MPTLSIPQEARAGIKRLYELPATAAAEISLALQAADLKSDPKDLTEALSSQVKAIDRAALDAAIRALWDLEFVRSSLDAPVEDFVSDIGAAMVKAELVTVEQVTSFHGQLVSILQCPALQVPSKARSLLREGTTFCRVRILTDIRPVFSSTEVDHPKAALIVHNLTLSYHQGSDIENVTVMLEPSELSRMIDVMQRAKEKEKRLESLIQRSGAQILRGE